MKLHHHHHHVVILTVCLIVSTLSEFPFASGSWQQHGHTLLCIICKVYYRLYLDVVPGHQPVLSTLSILRVQLKPISSG
jgi:hypothetical protein